MSKKTRRMIFYSMMAILFFNVSLIGGILNISVILANDGKMPFKYDSHYEDENHFSYQEDSQIRMSRFSDRFIIGRLAFSLGDILIAGGGLLHFFSLGVVYKIFFKKEETDEKNNNEDK